MSRNTGFAADCGRLFDTVSTRYQNLVRNLDLQIADATLIPVSKPRPQYSYITDSGLPGCTAFEIVRMGRSADRRRPSKQISEAGALQRVRPSTSRYNDRGDRASRPRRQSAAYHQKHDEQKELEAGASEHARGTDGLAGASGRWDADQRARHQHRSNQRPRPSCAALWRLQIQRRCFRRPGPEHAPVSAPAALRPRKPPVCGKYLSPRRRHASATGAVNKRIWGFKNPSFVSRLGSQ
ncbi:hypothetical protein SAMN04487925_10162 [Bradyrhizobium sp. cf659]|nr:hypothetical protein SAMN04487925_10162 [Bradyrhizobium sp. cf659]